MCDTQKLQEKVQAPIQVSEQQQKRVENNQYVIRRMDEMQYNIEAEKIGESSQDNILRKNVREAIVQNLGRERYAAFDDLKIKQEGEPEEEKIALHHAEGSKLALNGEDVIEFNMAGTGYLNYRLPQQGMRGTRKSEDYKDEKKVSWYNKNKFLTWTKLVKTEGQIEEYNESSIRQNKRIETVYGQRIEKSIKGQKLNHVRKKEAVNELGAAKTRFYMRGPDVANLGKYSEDKLEEYILELGKEALRSKLTMMDFLDDEELKGEKPINILIQGHSRGAVASGLGAMRIKRWISDTYPRLLDKVKFQLIQYDPVAGGYENFGFNAKIDHVPAKEKDAKKDSRYMSLGAEAETTVYYSMHTEYAALFTPQYVKGAKRIILSASGHGSKLDNVDYTQGKIARGTYLAEKNGKVEAFRSSGLNELDEGVYFADDQNNLIKIRNLEEFDAVAKTLLKDVMSQESRHEVVRKAVEAWFQRDAEKQTKEKEAVKEGAAQKTDQKEAVKQEQKNKELASLTTPAALKKVQEEKEKLDKMPQETPEQARKYLKKKEKYLEAKKSGMINYVDSLYKQKGSYINRTRRDYLRVLVKLSYQLEKDTGGFHTADRQKKIEGYRNELKKYAGIENLNVFLPAYLKSELYLGSEEKVREFLGMPALKVEEETGEKVAEQVKEEKQVEEIKTSEKTEEKAAEEKTEEKQEEEIKTSEKTEEKEAEAEKSVEEKVEAQKQVFKELPFVKHDVQSDVSGMDGAYENQEMNNCFCCAGTAMLNHFISRNKGYKSVQRYYGQRDFRSFRPEVRKYDPNNPAQMDEETYNSIIRDIDRYAGANKAAFGSIFEMGDFILNKLSEAGIDNVMLNRVMLTVPISKEQDKTEAERAEVKLRNYKAILADRINQIIAGGSVAGVLIAGSKNPHYVTVTGIKGDELTVYDSHGYTGKASTVKLDELVKGGNTVEVNWLSEVKDPKEMEKEYPNLEMKEGQEPKLKNVSYSDYYTSLSLTKGITVSKQMDGDAEGMEDVSQMAYIPVKNIAIEKKQLDEVMADAFAYEQEQELKQKEAERKESERKANELFDRSVTKMFNDIFIGRGSFEDIFKKLDKSFDAEDGEKVTYKRMRAAAEKIRLLAGKMGDPKYSPQTGELMEAILSLSESSNSYYDLHRGHQYTERGQKRRAACDSIRQLAREFYDRLDKQTGGTGFGNVTETKLPEGVTAKEVKASGAKLKELYENYQKWKKHFATREGSDRVNVRDKAALFASYERYIEIYKASHPIRKRSKEMDEIIREAELYKLQNSVVTRFESLKTGFNDPLSKLARLHADAMDNKSAEKELDKKDTDKGLSTEQIKAIDAIDQWFVRNYSNTGLVGWAVGARNHHGEAVSALLGKSKRERLFIYYLIETKKRKNPDISDVYASQADYVPDLEKFKGQMLHTRLKVLSHLSGQYVAMHKLSEATQINREYKELIKDCAEPVTISDKTKLKELKTDKIAYRTYMLGEVYQSTKTYRDKAAAFLKKGKKDAKAEAELEALKKKAEADLKELIAADSAVDEAEQYGDITEEGTLRSAQVSTRANSNSGDLSSNTRYAAKYGAKLAENTGTIVKDALSGANFVKSGVQKVIPSIGGGSWKLKDSVLAKTEFFSGTVSVSGISALGSLMATIYGVYNFSRGYSGMHAGDFGANIVKILNSTASATTTAWKGVQVTQQYIASADSLFNGTIKVSPALQVAGMVTGGVGTGLETYNTLSGMLDCRNASKAASFLNKKDRNKGNVDAKQAKYERNMLKVSRDISAKKTGMGGFNTVASGLTMAGLLVPVFGTAITLTGVGLTMASGVVSIFGMDMKGIRKKIFDSYFNFDEFVNKALAVMEARGEKVHNMKEFRRNMRRTLAAAAGFSDVESACDHIGKQYADFICKKLFGEDGERTTDENERKGYIQLVKSFGLPYSEKKKTPSAAALARKISGR